MWPKFPIADILCKLRQTDQRAVLIRHDTSLCVTETVLVRVIKTLRITTILSLNYSTDGAT